MLIPQESERSIETAYNSTDSIGWDHHSAAFTYSQLPEDTKKKFTTEQFDLACYDINPDIILKSDHISDESFRSAKLPHNICDVFETDYAFFSFLTSPRSTAVRHGPSVLLGKAHFWLSDFFVKNNFPDSYDPEQFKKTFLFSWAKMDPRIATSLNKIIGPIDNIDTDWIQRASQLDWLLYRWERAGIFRFANNVYSVAFDRIENHAAENRSVQTFLAQQKTGLRNPEVQNPFGENVNGMEDFAAYVYGRPSSFEDWPSIIYWPATAIHAAASRILWFPRSIVSRLFYKPHFTSEGVQSVGGCSMDSAETVPVCQVSEFWRDVENYWLFDPIKSQRGRMLGLYNTMFPYLFECPNFSFALKNVFLLFGGATRYTTTMVFFSALCVLLLAVISVLAGRYTPVQLAVFMEIFGLSLASFFSSAAFTFFDPIGQVFASIVLVLVVLEFVVLLTFIVVRQVVAGQKVSSYTALCFFAALITPTGAPKNSIEIDAPLAAGVIVLLVGVVALYTCVTAIYDRLIERPLLNPASDNVKLEAAKEFQRLNNAARNQNGLSASQNWWMENDVWVPKIRYLTNLDRRGTGLGIRPFLNESSLAPKVFYSEVTNLGFLYLSVLLFSALVLVFGLFLLLFAFRGGVISENLSYECGSEQVDLGAAPLIRLPFYRTVVVFLLFEVEFFLLFPVLPLFSLAKLSSVISLSFFMLIVQLSVLREIKSGELHWLLPFFAGLLAEDILGDLEYSITFGQKLLDSLDASNNLPGKRQILANNASQLNEGIRCGRLGYWFTPLYWALMYKGYDLLLPQIELFRFFHQAICVDRSAAVVLFECSHKELLLVQTLSSTPEAFEAFLNVIEKNLSFFNLADENVKLAVKIWNPWRRSIKLVNKVFLHDELRISLQNCWSAKAGSVERHAHCRNYLLMRCLNKITWVPEYTSTLPSHSRVPQSW